MTDRQIKMYAISGIISRLKAEKKKLKKATEINRYLIEQNINTLQEHYNELLKDITDISL